MHTLQWILPEPRRRRNHEARARAFVQGRIGSTMTGRRGEMPRRPRLGRVGAGCTDRTGDVVTDLVRLREVPHVFTPIASSSTGTTVALVSPTRACSGGRGPVQWHQLPLSGGRTARARRRFHPHPCGQLRRAGGAVGLGGDPALSVQSEFISPGHGIAPRRHSELAVQRDQLGLHRVA